MVSMVGKALTADGDESGEQNADDSVSGHRIRHRSSDKEELRLPNDQSVLQLNKCFCYREIAPGSGDCFLFESSLRSRRKQNSRCKPRDVRQSREGKHLTFLTAQPEGILKLNVRINCRHERFFEAKQLNVRHQKLSNAGPGALFLTLIRSTDHLGDSDRRRNRVFHGEGEGGSAVFSTSESELNDKRPIDVKKRGWRRLSFSSLWRCS